MKKLKILGLLLITIGMVFIGVSLYISYFSDNEVIDEDNDIVSNHKGEVENIINKYFISTDTTSNGINSVMGKDYDVITNYYIAVGKDSYMRYIPENIDNLDEYLKQQEIYSNRVESKYLDNIYYSVAELDDGSLFFKIKPWYFSQYAFDLSSLINQLLLMAGIDENLIETNYDEYSIYEYKARVKSLMILDNYLDNYNNKDEIIEFVFYYDGDTPRENQYYSLYLNLIGATSEYFKNDIGKEKRVSEYLNDAIKSGLVDMSDPLGLSN